MDFFLSFIACILGLAIEPTSVCSWANDLCDEVTADSRLLERVLLLVVPLLPFSKMKLPASSLGVILPCLQLWSTKWRRMMHVHWGGVGAGEPSRANLGWPCAHYRLPISNLKRVLPLVFERASYLYDLCSVNKPKYERTKEHLLILCGCVLRSWEYHI
jgi:hypothetical protein